MTAPVVRLFLANGCNALQSLEVELQHPDCWHPPLPVGFHNSYFGKTSLESARLKSQYQIISDFTQNRRQQQILSKTHKYFLFDFFATNADYFSFSQTQTKEILTSFDVFGLREASA